MPQKLVEHLDLYRQIHFHELESRQNLVGRMQMSFGLAIALAGALAYIIERFDKGASGVAFILFLPLLLCGVASLGWAAHYLRKTFWDHTYKEMDLAEHVRDHEKKQYDYFFTEPKPTELLPPTKRITAKELFDTTFKEYLVDRFSSAATHNAKINDDRANHLHVANRGIIHAAAYTFLAFVVFVVGNLNPPGITDIRIVEAEGERMLMPPNSNGPRDLTREQLQEEICRAFPNGLGEIECSANDSTKLKRSTSSAAEGPAGAATGAIDQGRRGTAAPATTTREETVTDLQQASGQGQPPPKEPPVRPPDRNVRGYPPPTPPPPPPKKP